jgi:hypothetical protein
MFRSEPLKINNVSSHIIDSSIQTIYIIMSEKEQQQQREEQQRQDSVQSDAFDYGDDPDDFVANQKPSGNKRGTNHTKNKQGSVYSSKHSRIKQAQRESRNTTKPNHHQAPSTKK